MTLVLILALAASTYFVFTGSFFIISIILDKFNYGLEGLAWALSGAGLAAFAFFIFALHWALAL